MKATSDYINIKENQMVNRSSKIFIIKYLIIFVLLSLTLYGYFRNSSLLLCLAIAFIIIIAAFDFILIKKININTSKDTINSEENVFVEVEKINKESVFVSSELKNSIDKINEIRKELLLKNEELDALSEASEIITSTFDVTTIIEYIYKVFNKFTGCDRCLIIFNDKETNNLICKYEYGSICFGEEGKSFGSGSVILDCFKSEKSIIKSKIFIEKRKNYGDKMAIPLRASGEMVGVIFMETAITGKYEKVNIGFLENLAMYAAIAVKNAELFSNIYLQKQEIEALYEETAAVNEELSCYIEELNVTKEELKSKNEELTKYYNNIQTGYIQTVMSLSNAIEAKDSYTRGHCQRVMEIACEIGRCLKFDDIQIDDLRYAAILHDIGKIGIPASIINKDGKLTEEEYNEIKKHPLIAYTILKDVEFLKNGLDGILQHHERYDGRGYPYGIKGNSICLFGKILCIADALDAMTSDRPYRKAMNFEAALAEIERCKGTQFDPEISDVFLKMSKEVLNFRIDMQGEMDFE